MNLEYRSSLYHLSVAAFPLVDQESFLRRLTCSNRLHFRDHYWGDGFLYRTGSEERKLFFQTMLEAKGNSDSYESAMKLLASTRFLFTQNFGISSGSLYVSNFFDIPRLLLLEAFNRRLFEEVFDHIWIASLEDYHFIVHHPRPEYGTNATQRQFHEVQIVVHRELLCLDPEKGKGVLEGDCYFHYGQDIGIYDDKITSLRGESFMAESYMESMRDILIRGGWKNVFPPLGKIPPVKSLKMLAEFAVLKKVVLYQTYWIAETIIKDNCLHDVYPEEFEAKDPYKLKKAQMMKHLESLFQGTGFVDRLSRFLEKYHFLLLCVAIRSHRDVYCCNELYKNDFHRYFTRFQLCTIEDEARLFSY